MKPRLTAAALSELTPEQRALHQQICNGPRTRGPRFAPLVDQDGRLTGPFAAMLLSPSVGTALQALGAALRYESRLPPRMREIAVLAVASHCESPYERYAHEAAGREAGLTEAEITALRDGGELTTAGPAERVALATVRRLLRAGDLDDGQYAEAIDHLGEAGVFELSTLVGYYSTLALQLRLFRIDGPPAT